MTIKFNKMQTLGNDFVVFETLTQSVVITPDLIKKMADRHYGIGCDQVLIISKTQHPSADFDYLIYNADGSRAGQCGNGARCVGLFVKQQQLTEKNQIVFVTAGHLTQVTLHDTTHISASIGVPNFDPSSLPLLLAPAHSYVLTLDDITLTLGALSVSNPHAVIQVPDVDSAAVDLIGRALNQHPLFPKGVNVSFCQIISRDIIKLRVFERGAGETLACGSGAGASMAYLRQLNLVAASVRVQLLGGALQVTWAGAHHPVVLDGTAENVFQGVYP